MGAAGRSCASTAGGSSGAAVRLHREGGGGGSGWPCASAARGRACGRPPLSPPASLCWMPQLDVGGIVLNLCECVYFCCGSMSCVVVFFDFNILI
jgi:hypothetical protein